MILTNLLRGIFYVILVSCSISASATNYEGKTQFYVPLKSQISLTIFKNEMKKIVDQIRGLSLKFYDQRATSSQTSITLSYELNYAEYAKNQVREIIYLFHLDKYRQQLDNPLLYADINAALQMSIEELTSFLESNQPPTFDFETKAYSERVQGQVTFVDSSEGLHKNSSIISHIQSEKPWCSAVVTETDRKDRSFPIKHDNWGRPKELSYTHTYWAQCSYTVSYLSKAKIYINGDLPPVDNSSPQPLKAHLKTEYFSDLQWFLKGKKVELKKSTFQRNGKDVRYRSTDSSFIAPRDTTTTSTEQNFTETARETTDPRSKYDCENYARDILFPKIKDNVKNVWRSLPLGDSIEMGSYLCIEVKHEEITTEYTNNTQFNFSDDNRAPFRWKYGNGYYIQSVGYDDIDQKDFSTFIGSNQVNTYWVPVVEVSFYYDAFQKAGRR